MENEVVKVNGTVTVEKVISKKGNPFKAVYVTVNGKKVQVGFVNAYVELALIKAGVEI